MTRFALLFALSTSACMAQDAVPAAPAAPPPDSTAVRTEFHVRYVSDPNVYIDGGRDAGLTEGAELLLKQDPTKAAGDAVNTPLEPGVIARLKVVSVASTSAVCEVEASARNVAVDDVVSLADADVEKLVARNTLGNTRKYPMVVSFTEGDPLDEEVRTAIPRPPLPEVNQLRGRFGFDVSTIHELGAGASVSNSYGFVFRADFTRIFGTHWNLNGYWRGSLRTNSSAYQATLQDVLNRTYLMSLTYVNPQSHWTAGIGRLYLPWASSLETIDGAYVARMIGAHAVLGAFAGSTPDPSAWDYDPKRHIGGTFVNVHGGSFDHFHFSSTAGMGVDLMQWTVQRPFVFTENELSLNHYFSIYHSMQIDRPAPNPGTVAAGTGLGQSLLSLRIQADPHVTFDITDTYFRDVPTYDPTLVGTGLLDKYLYQGLNGGIRIEFPLHIATYFSLGTSKESTDGRTSLNKLFAVTLSQIGNTGIEADARYSQFASNFATGTYTTFTVSREMLDNLRVHLQAGRYAYSSSVAATSSSDFINCSAETNLGSHLFLESMFTAERGGSLNYNQWTTTLGYRFNNRAAARRAVDAPKP